MFYYGNERNRMWMVLSKIFDDILPLTISEKKEFLRKHHIAMWDVIKSCDIVGASDLSIKNVEIM